MLLQNREVLVDAERTAAEGYAPLKRALARFQQLLREEGRDTADGAGAAAGAAAVWAAGAP